MTADQQGLDQHDKSISRRVARTHQPRAIQRVNVRTAEVTVSPPSRPAAPGPGLSPELDRALARAPESVAITPAAPASVTTRAAKPRRRAAPASLFTDQHFRAFWISRVTSAAAEGALLYAFLLLVVDQGNRAALNSVFVICSLAPAILFGLPAGIAVDSLPRRGLLATLNLLRFVFVLVLVLYPPVLPGIFAAAIGVGLFQQFYLPAENAALPALTPTTRLPDGQSLFNLAGAVAQLLGMVILAPVFLKTAGPEALYAVCASLFFVAAGFNLMLPVMNDHLAPKSAARRSMTDTLRDGWRVIAADQATARALSCDVLIGIGMSSLIVIAPLYLNRVLDTPAENTVFVFAPAALGLVLGLRIAPGIGRRFGYQRTAILALLGFALCVACFGFIVNAREFITSTLGLPLDKLADLVRIPSAVLLVMLLSVPAGLFSSLVSVPARTMLLTRTPPSRRGQTLATAGLLMGIGALAPTLLSGVAADAFGIEKVAVAIGVVIATGAVVLHTMIRPLPTPTPAAPGPAAT